MTNSLQIRRERLIPVVLESPRVREYAFAGTDALAELLQIQTQIGLLDAGQTPDFAVDNIYGPPGIGKTAFLQELARRCTLEGRGWAYADLSKYNWGDPQARPTPQALLLEATTSTPALLPEVALQLASASSEAGDHAVSHSAESAIALLAKPTFVFLIDGAEVLLKKYPDIGYHQLVHLLQKHFILPSIEQHHAFVVIAGKREIGTAFYREGDFKRRTRLHKLQPLSAEETVTQLGITDVSLAARLADFTGGNPLANTVAFETAMEGLIGGSDLLTLEIIERQHDKIVENLARLVMDGFLDGLSGNAKQAFMCCILRDFPQHTLHLFFRMIPALEKVPENELLSIEAAMYESGLLEFGDYRNNTLHHVDFPFRLMMMNYLELHESKNLHDWFQIAHEYSDRIIEQNIDVDMHTILGLSPYQLNYYILSALYYRAQALRFEVLEEEQTCEKIICSLMQRYLDLRFQKGQEGYKRHAEGLIKMLESDPDLTALGYSQALIQVIETWYR